jgi:hypothetical protein
VIIAEAELLCRADHPVRNVPVRRARADRAARQGCSGQRDDDGVADDEVVRAADDPARLC